MNIYLRYLYNNYFSASWAYLRACLSLLTSRWSTSGCSSPWQFPFLRWSSTPPMRCSRIQKHHKLFMKQEWMCLRSTLVKKRKRCQRQTSWSSSCQRWWVTSCCPSAPLSSPSSSGLSVSSRLTPRVTLRMLTCLIVSCLILPERLNIVMPIHFPISVFHVEMFSLLIYLFECPVINRARSSSSQTLSVFCNTSYFCEGIAFCCYHVINRRVNRVDKKVRGTPFVRPRK